MTKRALSVILSLILILGVTVCAFAEKEPVLSFGDDGEFKIMHLCDCQDGYPASDIMLKYIDLALKKEKPDLVILGGDNTVCGFSEEELAGLNEQEKKDMITGLKKDAISELVSVFIENDTYFTLVFGNHDHQQGLENDELLALYQECGGSYCLAYDAVPELTGSGTHNLPVYGSDGKIKFNLYMLDSGDSAYDENGKDMGYDSVHEDQVAWYKGVRDSLKAQTGKYVPSMAFQHIIVCEIYDKLFFEDPLLGIREFNGTKYSFLPKTNNFTGHLLELPCPGYYNYGEFEAMSDEGDMLAMFFGHDHTNSFETEIDGVKLINTPSPTHHSYSSELNSGCRIITINENDTSTFETRLLTENEIAIENPEFAELSGRSSFAARFFTFADSLLLFLSKLSGLFLFFVK